MTNFGFGYIFRIDMNGTISRGCIISRKLRIVIIIIIILVPEEIGIDSLK